MPSTSVFAIPDDAAWTPQRDVQQRSHLWTMMRKLGVASVEDLHARAVQEPETYYAALIEHLDLQFATPYRSLMDLSHGPQFPSWFPGGKLNIVDTCLRRRDETDGARDALCVLTEDGTASRLSYAALRGDVQRLANFLTHTGARPGDCIGLFMAMTIEATIAFYACAWIGAVAVPAFSGYGPDALATRMKDCRVKILIASSGFQRRGAWVDMRTTAETATAELPDLQHVVLVGDPPARPDRRAAWISWTDALASNGPDVEPAILDPNAPLMLMYTSGTTGRPKGIVHSHAGFLLKVASDYALGFNIDANDRFCWITDLGWLVGPQMIVGATALGATAVYYVGALDAPDWEQIWRVCEREHVSVLGVSPTAIRGMAAAAPGGPEGEHDLSALKQFVSTGEPWDLASWRWLFDKVGRGQLPILNYSGGTEIGGGILTCYAALPLNDCAFTGPVIGMDVAILEPDGREANGSVGELVVRNLWPGMTHSFWGGADDLYLDTYWSQFPGIWRHGDLAQRDARGWWFVRGRSDDTLKVAGRRIGPTEIEDILLQSNEVIEAVVVGVPDDMKGQAIVAFVVAREGAAQSGEGLQAHVRRSLGASLVPSKVHFVASLPKTRNGKVMRRAIAARYLGLAPGDLSTLENPDALLAIPARASVSLS